MGLFVPVGSCLQSVRRRWIVSLTNLLFTFTLVVCAVWFVPEANASVLVSPARLELEVGEDGSDEALTFVNRGDAAVWLRLYAGLGTHAPTGAPLYFDDPESRRSVSRWIRITNEQLHLEPGELRQVYVHFESSPGAVAAYPVLFAEIIPAEGAPGTPPDALPNGSNARIPTIPQSVARVAIPALVTFRGARYERDTRMKIDDFRVLPLVGTASIQLDVDIANAGNVHGRTDGVIHAFDVGGRLLASRVLQPVRVLPGATRTLSLRWDARDLPQVVRFVAEVGAGDETEGPRRETMRMALTVAIAVTGDEVSIIHEAREQLPSPVDVARLSMLPARK